MKYLYVLCIVLFANTVCGDWPELPSKDWPPLVKLPPLETRFIKYERVCTASGCIEKPIYETVDPITVDEAAKLLARGGWSKNDSKRLENIIDNHYKMDIDKNSNQTVSEEQPPGLYSEGFSNYNFRIFGRRR